MGIVMGIVMGVVTPGKHAPACLDQTTVQGVSGIRYTCLCGWQGDPKPTMDEARDDHRRHVMEAQKAEPI